VRCSPEPGNDDDLTGCGAGPDDFEHGLMGPTRTASEASGEGTGDRAAARRSSHTATPVLEVAAERSAPANARPSPRLGAWCAAVPGAFSFSVLRVRHMTRGAGTMGW
jgi:hypothetical protein